MIRTTLETLLLAMTAFALFCESAAAADWPYKTTRGSFVFHADFPLDPNQPLVTELANLRDEVATTLGLVAESGANERIDVYLFADRAVYENYMRRYFPTLQPRRAMFIKTNSPGNVFAYISQEFAVDLRHETTHAVLHTCLPMVPLWLDEGLAEYFELPTADRRNGNPYLSQVRRKLTWSRPASLADLERMTQLEQMGTGEYRDAWAWVHFMLHGPAPARVILENYLASIARHEPPAPLSQSLARQFADPDAALAEHFRCWRR